MPGRVRDEDVCRLDVAVDEAMAMRHIEARSRRREDLDDVGRGERSLPEQGAEVRSTYSGMAISRRPSTSPAS